MAEKSPTASVRLSLLEQEAQRTHDTLQEIKLGAEKHRETHTQITEKIYGRMEDLRTELKADISQLKSDLERKISAQDEMLKKISDKLDSLDKWRWLVIGMATVGGYVLSKIFGIKIS
jgi:chromosome segregation ATPase